jgi:hypothetical protein
VEKYLGKEEDENGQECLDFVGRQKGKGAMVGSLERREHPCNRAITNRQVKYDLNQEAFTDVPWDG